MKYTDTEILDWLQTQNDKAKYTGGCLFRWSWHGRGWRLYETSQEGAVLNVREAIEVAMVKELENEQS